MIPRFLFVFVLFPLAERCSFLHFSSLSPMLFSPRCRSLHGLALPLRWSIPHRTILLQRRPTTLCSPVLAPSSSSATFSSAAAPSSCSSSSTPPPPKRNTLWRSPTALLRPPLALTQPVPLCSSPSSVASSSSSNPSLPIQVRYLADCPELVPAVAQALWSEWGDNFNEFDHMHDVAAVEKWIREECCETMQLGCTVIGVLDGEFVGCAMLCPEDTPSSHPYFGTVPGACFNFVRPSLRGRGVSRAVWGALIGMARAWGYGHVWAVADEALVPMYAPMGFRVVEPRVDFWGEPATVLRIDFAPNPPLTHGATPLAPLTPPKGSSCSSVVPQTGN